MGESSEKTWSTGEGNGKLLHYSCLANAMNCVKRQKDRTLKDELERLLLNHTKTPGFLASGEEEFNPGPEIRLDYSELLCNKILLKYKGDSESF